MYNKISLITNQVSIKMSAAVAGSVAASMRRNTYRLRGQQQENRDPSNSILNLEYKAYFNKYYYKHLAYIIYIKKVINNEYDNKFLQDIGEELYQEQSILQFLDLNDIKPAMMFMFKDSLIELTKNIDKYIFCKECLKEKFDLINNYIQENKPKG